MVSRKMTARGREVLIPNLKRNLWKGKGSSFSLDDGFRALFSSFPAFPLFLLCLTERQSECLEDELMHSVG